MTTNGLNSRLVATIAFAISTWAAFAAPAAAANRYTVTNLGALGGLESTGYGINNSGHVVGSVVYPNYTRAFLFDGTMHELGTLGGISSFARDINDDGLIAGGSRTFEDNQGFVYDGQMQAIGTLGGSVSYAVAINNSGHAVGTSALASNVDNRAILFDGQLHDLGTSGQSEANDINDQGWITGFYQITPTTEHAFLYDGEFHDLGAFSGSSVGNAINGSGHVAGYSGFAGGQSRAFLYDGAEMHNLGTLGGNASTAWDVNAFAEVVGTSRFETNNDAYHAFLWTQAGGMADLNELIDPLAGWELRTAYAMNDVGQITGVGIIDGARRAFLLTPIRLSADFNDDGAVTLLDFNILKSNFGQSGGHAIGDANDDRVVDLLDFNVLKSEFGSSAVVPEPSSAAALALLLACICRTRRSIRR